MSQLPRQIPQTNLSYHRNNLAFITPEDAARAIRPALERVFQTVEVDVVTCPDLSSWGLAGPGLCGEGKIFDIGGVPNMFNPSMQGSVFDITQIVRECGLGSGRRLVTGAGGGALTEAVGNSEWVGNCLLEDGRVVRNNSMISFIQSMSEIPQPYGVCACPQGSCSCGCLANVFVSKAETSGPVIGVKVRGGRKENVERPADWHETEFGRVVRTALGKLTRAPHEIVGVAGAARVSGASSMVHIMPPYFPLNGACPSRYPLVTMKGWGEVFFETSKPLVCLPVLLSSDGGWTEVALRVEHTHFYSADRSLAGHYHFDMNPTKAEKGFQTEAYFAIASEIIKVDPISSKL